MQDWRIPLPGFIALFFLTSCATMVTHETVVEHLHSSQPCCSSFDQFIYDDLSETDAVSVRLDGSSESFDFRTGKSFFKAFQLPNSDLPYSVKITSFALGEAIDEAHIFYPKVVFLDEHFAIVKQTEMNEFLLSKASWAETASETWGLPLKLEETVEVDTQTFTYILIFTTRDMMKQTSSYWVNDFSPVIFSGVVGVIPTGVHPVDIPHSPCGLLRVEILSTLQ